MMLVRSSEIAKALFAPYAFPVSQKKLPAFPKGNTWSSKIAKAGKKPLVRSVDSPLIAIDCGQAGLVVVDFDIYKPEFKRSRKARKLYKTLMKVATYKVKTKSGGVHIYFRGQTTLRNNVLPGVDIKSADCYVVAYGEPPTSDWNKFYEGLAEWKWGQWLEENKTSTSKKNLAFGPGNNNAIIADRVLKAVNSPDPKAQALLDIKELRDSNKGNPELEAHIKDYKKLYKKEYKEKVTLTIPKSDLKGAEDLGEQAILKPKFKRDPNKTVELMNRLEALGVEVRNNAWANSVETKGFKMDKWTQLTEEYQAFLLCEANSLLPQQTLTKEAIECMEKQGIKNKDASTKQLKKDVMEEAIKYLSFKNPYNPVKDKLNSLVWDKKPRLKNFLNNIFEVPDDFKEIARWAFPSIILGAIKRAYKPGHKHDHFVILQGKQGCGKSTFLRDLCLHPDWFSESVSFSNNEAEFGRSLFGVMLAEVAELTGVGEANREKMKKLITKKVDRIRPMRANRSIDHPRTVIFVGTTNKDQPIPGDLTGARRFIVVEVGIKHGWLKMKRLIKKHREQVFAEGVAWIKEGRGSTTIPEKLKTPLERIAEAKRDRNKALEWTITKLFARAEKKRGYIHTPSIMHELCKGVVGEGGEDGEDGEDLWKQKEYRGDWIKNASDYNTQQIVYGLLKKNEYENKVIRTKTQLLRGWKRPDKVKFFVRKVFLNTGN